MSDITDILFEDDFRSKVSDLFGKRFKPSSGYYLVFYSNSEKVTEEYLKTKGLKFKAIPLDKRHNAYLFGSTSEDYIRQLHDSLKPHGYVSFWGITEKGPKDITPRVAVSEAEKIIDGAAPTRTSTIMFKKKKKSKAQPITYPVIVADTDVFVKALLDYAKSQGVPDGFFFGAYYMGIKPKISLTAEQHEILGPLADHNNCKFHFQLFPSEYDDAGNDAGLESVLRLYTSGELSGVNDFQKRYGQLENGKAKITTPKSLRMLLNPEDRSRFESGRGSVR